MEKPSQRLPEDLGLLYLRSSSLGTLVPMKSIVQFRPILMTGLCAILGSQPSAAEDRDQQPNPKDGGKDIADDPEGLQGEKPQDLAFLRDQQA